MAAALEEVADGLLPVAVGDSGVAVADPAAVELAAAEEVDDELVDAVEVEFRAAQIFGTRAAKARNTSISTSS